MKSLSGSLSGLAILTALVALHSAWLISASTPSVAIEGDENRRRRHSIPDEFRPVDTGRLLGSPDPLPLEPERAFPNLKFQRPLELTHAGDGSGRVFVVEQRGVIHVFENRDDVDTAREFLDIRRAVSRDHNEEGLLGLAFHPKFRDNGEFFVYYSTRPRSSILSRFRVFKDNPGRADPESEEVLLQIDQPYGNHNGGSIRFGPDGFLYIGLGDGGAADDPHSHAQNLQTLLGSILRIDVDRQDEGRNYAIPADNPFADRADARGEIWAYGLRNVWRMAFDRKTGDLWAADVGQDRFEEVNRIRKGGNYGWNPREGFHPFEPNAFKKPTDLIEPIVEYAREDGQSVTGGQVYRGQRLKEFDGAYFYGDYLSGNIWIVRWDGSHVTEDRQVARTDLEIAAFGEDEDGEMYLCAFDGYIYRLRPRPIDREAVAAAFPRKLSKTGLFASVPDNEPAAGLIPYDLNMPFWSDFAVKDRYIALPDDKSVRFHERDKWEFPVGTVFVKTFWLHQDRGNLADPVRLETRLLVHSPEGWVGYTYVYNDEQTEAHLLDGSLLKPVEVQTRNEAVSQPYYFPSRSDCFGCHTKAEGFVLGTTTRQMNRTLRYRGQRENQIALLDRLGVFSGRIEQKPENLEKFPDWRFGNFDRSEDDDWTENMHNLPPADRDALARSWLEVNCAVCHRPEGIAPHARDMRFHISLDRMNLLGRRPSQGQLGPPDSLLIAPGRPRHSELIFRVGRRGPRQMPPLASNLVDPRGLEVLRQWIAEMDDTE
jgi:uncharacterized repeat protein (TIGR03806 family)